jgi:hypothetical protein
MRATGWAGLAIALLVALTVGSCGFSISTDGDDGRTVEEPGTETGDAERGAGGADQPPGHPAGRGEPGGRTLNAKSASQKLADAIVEQHPQLGEITVTCPEDIAAEEGVSFRCRVTGGARGTVKATQTDDEGNFDYDFEGRQTR